MSLWSNVSKVTSLWGHSVVLWRLWLLVWSDQASKGRTMSPIELFWTAKNTKNRRKNISRKTEFLIQILLMWQNESNFHERGIPQARMPAIFVCGKILEPKIPMYTSGEFAKQKKRNIYVRLPPRHSNMYASYKNNSSWKYCNLFSQSTAMYNDNTILSVSRPYLSWLQKQK